MRTKIFYFPYRETRKLAGFVNLLTNITADTVKELESLKERVAKLEGVKDKKGKGK